MLNFERIKFNSSQKVKVLDGNKIVLIINIEYYDKSNIQCINNLKILNISNELLPVHYKLELKKHNYLKKLITFSSPKKLDINLNFLNISSKDLENIYKKIKKIIDKNIKIHEVTLLINNVTKEVLYTFDKVYKKEFKY
jgi:hypothetical protein